MLWLCVVVGMVGGAACRDCDRDGCDAMNDRVRGSISQGIAGAVASQSDVVSSGMGQSCNECPLSSAYIGFWRTDTLVTDVEVAQAICQEQVPVTSVDADSYFGVELEAGTYLVCPATSMGTCGVAEVAVGKVTTVNIRMSDGFPILYVGDPGQAPAKATVVLSIECSVPDPHRQQAGECMSDRPFRSPDGQSCVQCLAQVDCQSPLRCEATTLLCVN
jgi:hypothetical protein